MSIATSFSERIIGPDIVRDLREKLGMTQAELAEEAKLSEADIKAYEAGRGANILIADAIGSALLRRGAVFPRPH